MAAFLLITGCATSLPMTSSVNDFVMMGTKTNSKESIKYTFTSSVKDGEIKAKNKDGSPNSGLAFTHTETSVLTRMLKEYMESKFTNISQTDSDVSVEIALTKFDLSHYSADSGGKQFATSMFGGETSFLLGAKVIGNIIVNKNGEKLEKKLVASAEDTFVNGVGTGTSSSNLYKGKDSINHTHARNINKANNKFLMQVNSFLEECGL